MCTVSFVPKSQGFYLAMNRDENLDRFAAVAPKIVALGSRRAVSRASLQAARGFQRTMLVFVWR